MIALIINNLNVEEDEILKATWEVSDKMNFSNIVAGSEEDASNLTGILLDVDLDPSVKYYSRCRLLLKKTGWTYYSAMVVLRQELHGYMNQNEDIPSRISTPTITTSALLKDSHPSASFDFKVSGFDVVGTGRHINTIYFIKDSETSEIVWSAVNRDIHKDEVFVDDVLLENNKIYQLMAIFVSSTGDTSQTACNSIKIGTNEIELLTPISEIKADRDVPMSILNHGSDIDDIYTYKVFVAKDEKLIETYTGTGKKDHVIPNGSIHSSSINVIRVINSIGATKDTLVTIF